MRLNRFIANLTLRFGSLNILDKDIYNQMKNVLRLNPGSRIILGDGAGKEAVAEIVEYKNQGVKIKILEIKNNENEPAAKPILYCAVLKKENFELAAQKATEVGISEIVPIITERTIKLNFKVERLNKIVREAAEQSGRSLLPKISRPLEFFDALIHAEKNDLNYFFEIDAPKFDQRILSVNFAERIGIFIGPEGGWSEREVEAARNKNFCLASLGKLTLRAETAAIIASYLVVH
jgi:16S rRNA (uracil1498-N3)-methyltransferase